MKVRNILAFLFMLSLTSCSTLGTSALDAVNPMKDDKGINTDVQLAKNATMTKKKQLVESNINTSSQDTFNQQATEMQINNMNINWWMLVIICLLSSQAIPTRAQYKQIQLLRESLEYERARTNITIEVNAKRQEAGHSQSDKHDSDSISIDMPRRN